MREESCFCFFGGGSSSSSSSMSWDLADSEKSSEASASVLKPFWGSPGGSFGSELDGSVGSAVVGEEVVGARAGLIGSSSSSSSSL